MRFLKKTDEFLADFEIDDFPVGRLFKELSEWETFLHGGQCFIKTGEAKRKYMSNAMSFDGWSVHVFPNEYVFRVSVAYLRHRVKKQKQKNKKKRIRNH